MSRNYIIGGGISGLIFAFYNQNFTIIEQEKYQGGQLKERFPLGPRFLQYDEYSTKLLNDLGIKSDVKLVKIGYFFKGAFYDSCPEDMRKLYYEKTRFVKSDNVPDSVMSDNQNAFYYFDVDFSEVIDKLSKNVKIIHKKVTEIDLFNKTIVVKNKKNFKVNIQLDYNRLATTISALFFEKLCGISNNSLRCGSKIFSLHNKSDLYGYDNCNYDYVYYPEKKYRFNRVTIFGDQVIIEYTTPNMSGDVSVNDMYFNAKQVKTLKGVQILSGQISNYGQNVIPVGRLANWNHDIKINDVIKQSIEFRRG